MIKSYSGVVKLNTYRDRYEYLKIGGNVGEETFGGSRWLNQVLYSSSEWKRFRRGIILRDNGCDLACPDRPISTRIYIHHINPITLEDIQNRNECVFDPENVICCSHEMHQAIHYGDESLLSIDVPQRRPNDTCPWR
jgi:hypothetical protein